jgi:hypothetical protein
MSLQIAPGSLSFPQFSDAGVKRREILRLQRLIERQQRVHCEPAQLCVTEERLWGRRHGHHHGLGA